MPKKAYTAEQIITRFREAEVLLRQGDTIALVSKSWESVSILTTAGVVIVILSRV